MTFQSTLRAAALFACAAFSLPAATPPEVGAKAPEFSLNTLTGNTVKLSQEIAKGPVVLVVLRGYPGYQCPYCNRQVQDYLTNQQGFADLGVRVVVVYPGPPADLDAKGRDFLKDKTLPAHFDLLLDPGYQFTNTYGLRWDAPRETAYPSTFLIDNKGVVFFSKVSKEHGGRTTAADILAELRKKSMAK